MAGFVGSPEQIAYVQGVEDAVREKKGEAPLHAGDNPQPFFYQRGQADQRGGFPLIPWDLVTDTALTAQEQSWYLEGYGRGIDIRNGRTPAPTTGVGRDYYEWVTAGTYDGQEGKYSGRYVITTEPRTAKEYKPENKGKVIVVLPPPNAPPQVYQGPPIYEVAAYFWRKLVPLDQLLDVSKFTSAVLTNPLLRMLWTAAIRFEVLGDAPDEHRQGYRLSGPNGPVAKYLMLMQRQPNPPFSLKPATYGLPAFFVTRVMGRGRRGGIRFLSRRELEQLGINPAEL